MKKYIPPDKTKLRRDRTLQNIEQQKQLVSSKRTRGTMLVLVMMMQKYEEWLEAGKGIRLQFLSASVSNRWRNVSFTIN